MINFALMKGGTPAKSIKMRYACIKCSVELVQKFYTSDLATRVVLCPKCGTWQRCQGPVLLYAHTKGDDCGDT